jgi:uncharacterized membrane protein
MINRNKVKHKVSDVKNFIERNNSTIQSIRLVLVSILMFVITVFIKIFSATAKTTNGFTEFKTNGESWEYNNKDEV